MNPSSSKVHTEPYWRFAVRHRAGILEAQAKSLLTDIADLGVQGVQNLEIAQIYYVSGPLTEDELKRIGQILLTDPMTQEYELTSLNPQPALQPSQSARVIEVAYHPGVRDPVEDSLKKGARDLGIGSLAEVHTAKVYTLTGTFTSEEFSRICQKLLMNATIQQIVTEENLEKILYPAIPPAVPIERVHLISASDTVLQRICLDHQLSLNLEEMRAIQAYFKRENRQPTLIELETIAQTWSEHCKHKTLRGDIVYTEEMNGRTQKRTIHNLLKSTIFEATAQLNKPWSVSVFEDNAGVIEFDEENCVCFKVETHNHPSALEPFGGASTGIGGVIRDILGTGLGGKPIASTDVFCFPPPDLPDSEIPEGALRPRRLIKGVVAGVKDYGNKMGIPTVNGAVLFDRRFAGNPLVYCGNVGLIPRDKVVKKVLPGMKIVLVGGLTGRDGIHGATFSSLSLGTESEVVSATAVQIGDPITEKKLTDALLEARDQALFSAVTDCGAGGLSSAVGELGARCGARVELKSVPLKYAGLNPTEIWISESQERMVLAVLPQKLECLLELFGRRDVKATVIGEFTDTGRLELLYQAAPVGTIQMDFLHEGLPQIARPARWQPPHLKEPQIPLPSDLTPILLKLLSRWDTCSKEWIIRQYDHEVQGGSVIKPLVGKGGSAPSDAAVVRPRLDSLKGVVLSNGINFRYGDLDPYWMAALSLEEALRQAICVGGTLDHLAVLDNFCWADPAKPLVLGSLVRAAFGCFDAAMAFGTPFISGKDSLHNEYRLGERTIQIPGTLLISAIGVMADVRGAVSMDSKAAGNRLYLVGMTRPELGGSAYYDDLGFLGASVPHVDLKNGPRILRLVSKAIAEGLVVSAHDCSEGGLGVAAAEMAFAGSLGLTIDLKALPAEGIEREDFLLFSESASRFLLEVPAEKVASFERLFEGQPLGLIGSFEAQPVFRVMGLQGQTVVETSVQSLKEAWERPFKEW